VATPLHSPPFHSPPLCGASPTLGTVDNTQRSHAHPNMDEGVERPAPSAKRFPPNRNSPLLRLFSSLKLRKRETVARCAQTVHARSNKALGQPMLVDHWPSLRPASLPVYHRTPATALLLPKSLPSLGKGTPLVRSTMTPHEGPPSASRIPHRVPHHRQVRATLCRTLPDTLQTYPRWTRKDPCLQKMAMPTPHHP
jgi:hypothetical protein